MSFENDITHIKRLIEEGPDEPIFKAATPENLANREDAFKDESYEDKVKRLAQEASEYFSQVGLSPSGDEIVGYVADIIEEDSGHMDEYGYKYIAKILHILLDESIYESFSLNEGFAEAKRRYVDQGITLRSPDGVETVLKIPLQVLKRLASKDPTNTKKYILWMAKIYLQQRSARGFDSIAKFEEMSQRNQIDNKDIYSQQYRTLEDVDDAINAAHAKKETKVKSKEEEFYDNLKIDTEVLGKIDKTPNEVNPDGQKGDLFFENDMIVIVCPSSRANSELYGRNPDPECRKDRPSYWCTATPNSRYFDQYWGSSGNVLYYILPKKKESVLYDPESGHSDRFTKCAIRVQSDGSVAEKRDRFNIMIEDDKWRELCKRWKISPGVSKSRK